LRELSQIAAGTYAAKLADELRPLVISSSKAKLSFQMVSLGKADRYSKESVVFFDVDEILLATLTVIVSLRKLYWQESGVKLKPYKRRQDSERLLHAA